MNNKLLKKQIREELAEIAKKMISIDTDTPEQRKAYHELQELYIEKSKIRMAL